MKKKEQEFHTKIMKWYPHNRDLFPDSFLFETKVVRVGDKNFRLSELSEKELRLLKQAKTKGIIQTHSDLGGMGTNCDGSVVKGGGFVFIKWDRRGNKTFYVIDIDTIIGVMEDDPKKKSLTEEECANLSKMKFTL